MDVEEGHRGGRLAAETVMPRSMFADIGTRQTDRSKNGKRFKGPGGEYVQNCGQHVMSVRTPEGSARESTWQVADVRRPLVSASHNIQAGNDLFIGKNEAYIMNRKKQEKSVLRKEGNVYVLESSRRRQRVVFDCSKRTF